MSVLYKNVNGKDVTHASYSARSTFRHCPREFQLTRIDGWSDKSQRAAPLFGKCIEAGLQAYEESGRTSQKGVEVFIRLWEQVKQIPEFDKLVFTASEINWDVLMKTGTQMMRLYEIRVPSLPISTHPKALFQQELRKKIFPGTNLDKLENKAIIDILSFPRWDHSALPKIEQEPNAKITRELIIDVKTAGKDLATDLVMLDPQLAEYAWQLRVPDVAFLWFVKKSHELERRDKITLLDDAGVWHAGWEGTVLEVGKPDATGDFSLYVGPASSMKYYEEYKDLRSKARAAKMDEVLGAALASGEACFVPRGSVTKQRLQFAAARLTEQDMDDTGRSVAQTTVEMVRAHEQGFYEKQPGIRFPNEKCNFCSMRWICLNRPEERDTNLTRRGEEWLDGIQDEGNE